MASLWACQQHQRGEPVAHEPTPSLPVCPEPICPAPVCPPCASCEEAVATAKTRSSPSNTSTTKKAAKPAPAGKVDLNKATFEELMSLPGVGKVTAERILAFRERRAFRKPRDLMRVKGIGRATWKKLSPHLEVGAP